MQYYVKIYGLNGYVVADKTSSTVAAAQKWAENWLWYNGDVGYIAVCSDSAGKSVFNFSA